MKGLIFACLILSLAINAQELPNLQAPGDIYVNKTVYYDQAGISYSMLQNIQNLTLIASRAYSLSANSAFNVASNLSLSLS